LDEPLATVQGSAGGAVYVWRVAAEPPVTWEQSGLDRHGIVYIGETDRPVQVRLNTHERKGDAEDFVRQLRVKFPGSKLCCEATYARVEKGMAWVVQNRLLASYGQEFGRLPPLNGNMGGITGRYSAPAWSDAIAGITEEAPLPECLTTRKAELNEGVNEVARIARGAVRKGLPFRGDWTIESVHGGRYRVARCDRDGYIYRVVGQSIRDAKSAVCRRVELLLYRRCLQSLQWRFARLMRCPDGAVQSDSVLDDAQRSAAEQDFMRWLLDATGLSSVPSWSDQWWITEELLTPQPKGRYTDQPDPFGDENKLPVAP
jgi:hypothetical protein